MENTKLEINLKDFLDEKFSEIHVKLNNLENLRQDEHDAVVSMARDISYRTDEIEEIKKNATQCKTDCMKRKEDFDKRVITIVDPRIDSKLASFRVILTVAVVIFLSSVVGYLIDKYVLSPVQRHVERLNK